MIFSEECGQRPHTVQSWVGRLLADRDEECSPRELRPLLRDRQERAGRGEVSRHPHRHPRHQPGRRHGVRPRGRVGIYET